MIMNERITTKRKILFPLMALACVIISLSCSLYASETDWIFREARSFGTFSLGQDFKEVQGVLGAPDLKKDVQGGFLVKYEKPGIIFQVNGGSNAIQFIGSDRQGYKGASYKTPEGISVGSPRTLVEKHYSQPASVVPVKTKEFYPHSLEMALYASRGIAFHYDSSSKVAAIIIFNPNLFGCH
jgi:hypothetical protein